MRKPEDTPEVRELLVRMIADRARVEGAGGTIAMVRGAYDDLAAVLVPLVSQSGFDALVARASQLAQREYPAGEPPGGEVGESERFVEVRLWLERLNQRQTIDAAAAMFAALVALLSTLIGESLTTRYLRKAWPDGFPAGVQKDRK